MGPGPEGLVTPCFGFSPRAEPTAETLETCPTWWIVSHSGSLTLQPQEEDEKCINKTKLLQNIFKEVRFNFSVRYIGGWEIYLSITIIQ